MHADIKRQGMLRLVPVASFQDGLGELHEVSQTWQRPKRVAVAGQLQQWQTTTRIFGEKSAFLVRVGLVHDGISTRALRLTPQRFRAQVNSWALLTLVRMQPLGDALRR